MNRIGDTITGYMCLITAEHELGCACGGSKVYPSIEDLKEHHSPWPQCGIAKVEVKFVAEVLPFNMDWKKGDPLPEVKE